jgi:hypothetical protein
MADEAAFRGESTVLRRLLGLMMASYPAATREQILSPGAHFATAAAYFLLDVEPQGGVETFITYTLGRLLRQLNRNTEQRRAEYRGQIRGRIEWTATFKARHRQDYDPTRYVCREVRHQYDTPENQLLKYLVERMGECLQAIPEVIRAGACYFPATGNHGPPSTATAARLGRMEAALNNFRRNVRLQYVTLPQHIDELHLLRAETARMEEYAALARIYRRYRAVVVPPSWAEIVAIGKRMIPLPGHAGPDGDPWIRLGAAVLRASAASHN